MDILTHAISGTAVATCAVTFVSGKSLCKLKILGIGALGGVWPDIDAVSMWSKFDSVFGHMFGLSSTGRVIYGSKLWYSHHAFFHSLLAAILFGLMIFLLIYFYYRIIRSEKKASFPIFAKEYIIYPITFIAAYLAHLAGDLPTPASVWGGIAFLWPSDNYVGGFGKIWWWNNYDIFLLILFSIIANLGISVFLKKNSKRLRAATFGILCVTVFLIVIQINTRQYNYAYTRNTSRYAEMEINSKKEQERILGKRLYRYMEWFDRKMPFYF